jgi:hypothetical protein
MNIFIFFLNRTKKNRKNPIFAPKIQMHNSVFHIIYETNIITDSIDINTVPDAIAYLFLDYILFDLKYPETFQQVLGWFHEFVFKFE